MTPEEESATEAFEASLKALLEAFGYDRGVLVDWVLVSAQHVIPDSDPESRGATAAAMFFRFGQAPYRTDGLLDYGKFLVSKTYNDWASNG